MNGYFFSRTVDKIKKDKFLANSTVFFIGSLLFSLGGYFFHFLMARMLSVKDYGELQSLIAVSTIVGIPSATLLTSLVKYSAHFKARQQMGKVYSLFSIFTKKILLVGLIFFIIFVLFSRVIAGFLNLSSVVPVIIFSFSFLFIFLYSVNSGVIQGLQKFKDASIISVASVVFKIIIAVLLIKIGFGINGAVGGIVLAGIIGYLISFYPIKFLFKQKKEEIETKEIFKYFLPVFFTLLFTALFYNIDIILVKHFFPPPVAGQYGALALLGHIVFFIGGPISVVMFPTAAAAHSNNSDHSKVFKKTISLMGLIGLGVLFFYFLFPGLIIKILVGSKFLSISKFLGWFGFSMFLYSLINAFSRYFLAIHKTKYVYLIGIGVLLQVILISIWHSSLWQIVWIMNVVMAITLALLIGYYFKCAKNLKPQELENS